jgi:aldose sugar dehydrogenase
MPAKARAARVLVALFATSLCLGAPRPADAQGEEPVDYRTEIRPLLADYCYACHGPDPAKREAGLRLDEKRSAFADRGSYRMIVPGRPEESEVWLRVASELAEDRMPPYTAGLDLSDDQKALIRRWIEEGAEWPEDDEVQPAAAAQAAERRRQTGLPAVEVPAEPFVIHTHEIADVRVVPLTHGLAHPWSLAFLPKGDLLITERGGSLRLFHDGVLVPEPIEGVPTDVLARGLSGMMEVALHPRFEQNRLVYLTYTRRLSDRTGTVALVRGRLEGTVLRDVEDVFVAEPWLDDASVPTGGQITQLAATSAARLAFAPDGTLFMTMGGAFGVERDDGTSSFMGKGMLAQEPSSHAGKLLRLNDDGTVPKDNPFYGRPGYKAEIYSLGHRNQQGLALHPVTGQPFAVEHAPQGGDELNAIEPGANYGWPIVSYGRHYDGPRIAKQFWREGLKEPVVFWVPSIAPSGLTFYTGDRFPEWQGNVFVGALMVGRIPRTGHLQRIVFNERGEELRRESLLGELRQRIRDVRQGPDGLLYVLTEENQAVLLRLEPVE